MADPETVLDFWLGEVGTEGWYSLNTYRFSKSSGSPDGNRH